MCPGMRPATGWMAYLHLDALLLEQLGQLAHVVLRLRHRHPVAGDDDDLAGEGELHGNVLGRRRAHGAPVVGAHPGAGARSGSARTPRRARS